MKLSPTLGTHSLPTLPTRKKPRRRVAPLIAGLAGSSAAGLFAYRKLKNGQSMKTSTTSTATDVSSDELRRHVADMLALDTHILEAMRHEVSSGQLDAIPHVRAIVAKSCEAFEQQTARFNGELEQLGGAPARSFMKMAAGAAGKLVPLVQRSRSESLPRAIRDDIVALHLASVSASMLSTTALALDYERIADSAREGSESFARCAGELREALPAVVLRELLQQNLPAAAALENAVAQHVETRQEANVAERSRSNGVTTT